MARLLSISLCAILLVVACGPNGDDDGGDQSVPEVVALLQSQTPDRAIDVVFVAEEEYGDLTDIENRLNFLDDLGPLISDGFWENEGISGNHQLFNFWYLIATADLPTGAMKPCITAEWPDLTVAAFADVYILVHAEEMRDCRSGRKATTEPNSYRTVVHEFSHAAFGLPDEYNGAGRYWSSPPVIYEFEEDCRGDPFNSDWRDCATLTERDGDVWWRSEGSHCDIMRCPGAEVFEYGPGDWITVRAMLAALGAGPVLDPTTYAPDSWDAP